VLTWVTVLFAPWIFARQIVQRVRWQHAFVFGAICFAGTSLGYLSGMDAEFQATWLCTAMVYILIQTVWLAVLDPEVWQRNTDTLRFWFLVGCYTSAVMLTEIVFGPPPLFLIDLWDLLTTGQVDTFLNEIFDFGLDSVVWWSQLCLWLVALCCVYARRVSRRPASRRAVVWTVLVGASLLLLYAAIVQGIGVSLFNVFD
jgi:hypothetical protein